MNSLVILGALALLCAIGYYLGRSRSAATVGGKTQQLHSLPSYHGVYVAIWCGLPALIVFVVWQILGPQIVEGMVISSLSEANQELSAGRLGLLLNDIRNLAAGDIVSRDVDPILRQAADYLNYLENISRVAMGVVVLAIAIAGLAYGRSLIAPRLRARNQVERMITLLLIAMSTVAILTTVGIVLSLVFEAARFFAQVSPIDFLFGTQWSPQIALREGQVGGTGLFGAIPLFVGTLLISFIAMCVAAPVGLLAAIYMAEYAHSAVRTVAKPVLEILAGVPTVVYGFFAALTVAPFFRNDIGGAIGIEISSESALAAGVVMGIMLIPFVSSLSDDVISAVPQSLREGSYGIGATRSETIRKVIFPAALPGIVGGLLLAVSRAIGETMIVVMAAGLAANLTANPLEAVTTVTVQIVSLLIGDQEFDNPKTLAAFALGLLLFCVTLVLNVIALRIVNKYREQYE